ncbi:hypothetical protein OC835_004477 [Tilletia horrida]|nr:hypothetical protein OC835_004477 [Tilletia horrida]KAK0550343.1 hypothetical protein OC844_006740 [Tilletia horrida]
MPSSQAPTVQLQDDLHYPMAAYIGRRYHPRTGERQLMIAYPNEYVALGRFGNVAEAERQWNQLGVQLRDMRAAERSGNGNGRALIGTDPLDRPRLLTPPPSDDGEPDPLRLEPAPPPYSQGISRPSPPQLGGRPQHAPTVSGDLPHGPPPQLRRHLRLSAITRLGSAPPPVSALAQQR